METDTIWILLFIGYAIGLIPIALLGIMGTNEAIDYQNKVFERPGFLDSLSSIERDLKSD